VAILQHDDPIEVRMLDWVRKNQRTATIMAAGVALIAGGIWFWLSAQQRRENFAERALQSARTSAEAGNLALAASDLASMVSKSEYRGTRASEEAQLILAQVRMSQNQPALVVTDLRRFVESGPREEFRGPGYGLLGTALEETGQFGDAAKAYEEAVAATPYNGIKAQYLLDQARVLLAAGDTTRAVGIYQRVTKDFETTASAIEAQVRLGEVTRASLPGLRSAS
jgi:outer membrane protein assembly factor BamD (BamD/ComL family)